MKVLPYKKIEFMFHNLMKNEIRKYQLIFISLTTVNQLIKSVVS